MRCGGRVPQSRGQERRRGGHREAALGGVQVPRAGAQRHTRQQEGGRAGAPLVTPLSSQ